MIRKLLVKPEDLNRLNEFGITNFVAAWHITNKDFIWKGSRPTVEFIRLDREKLTQGEAEVLRDMENEFVLMSEGDAIEIQVKELEILIGLIHRLLAKCESYETTEGEKNA